jgi:hypothetical protein
MRRLIFSFLLLAMLITPYFAGAVKLGGLEDTTKSAGIKTSNDVNSVSGKILNPILSFVGILFFGLMIYAGILWMTAMGDEKKIDQAKSIILAAVIGLIIVAGAYAITNFVSKSLISPTTTNTTS